MAKAKLTKKQYTRKRLFAAVVLFIAVALVVTGVAIWLLFSVLRGSASGSLKVGALDSSPFEFENLRIDGVDPYDQADNTIRKGFIFDTAEGDEYGRVTWDGTSFEKLSVRVTGILTNAQHLQSFSYVLELPQGVIDAAEKGYLDISQFYDKDTGEFVSVVVDLNAPGCELITYEGETVWRFDFTIELKWGSAFDGINPSLFFDKAGRGLDTPIDEVVATLNDMRNTILEGSVFIQPTFTLTFTASPIL